MGTPATSRGHTGYYPSEATRKVGDVVMASVETNESASPLVESELADQLHTERFSSASGKLSKQSSTCR